MNTTVNNTNIAKAPLQNRQQIINVSQAFSQLQSMSTSSANAPSPELLQNVFQLIQDLLRQLENNKEQPSSFEKEESKDSQKESREVIKEKNPDQNSPSQQQESVANNIDSKPVQTIEKAPDIALEDDGLVYISDLGNKPAMQGTTGNDTLNGTRGGEKIEGLAGNDRISGRQGDDELLGGEGNDRLYGGKGDDTLEGGAGNDYLSGGAGNNKLFGGAGDDTLYSRLGSDIMDGGIGNDTARIRDDIENYTINIPEVLLQGAPSGVAQENPITLTHKETGKTLSIVNVENFKFNGGVRLSFDELAKRAETEPQLPDDNPAPTDSGIPSPINNISGLQNSNILEHFSALITQEIIDKSEQDGIERPYIISDDDNSGDINAGDRLIVGNKVDGNLQEHLLTVADVRAINRPEYEMGATGEPGAPGFSAVPGDDGSTDDPNGDGFMEWFTRTLGDLNGDGVTDEQDVTKWYASDSNSDLDGNSEMGEPGGPGFSVVDVDDEPSSEESQKGFMEWFSRTLGDLNKDGAIDEQDVTEWQTWGDR